MKKTTLFVTALLLGTASFAQTTLFSDDFESGDGAWTLNTVTGTNGWTVNNSYTGFTSQLGTIVDTPDQPSGITGNPQSSYLHIVNSTACSVLQACNANFDTGSASESYAEITSAISTVSYMNTEISFWWLCEGSAGNTFGTLEYSTDNGTTWTATGTDYSGNGTWTQETVSMASFDGVAELKFRFKWENNAQGDDPAFAIDDIEITADQDFTSVSELDNNNFTVAPNPAGDFIQIQSKSNEAIENVTIATTAGTIVARDLTNNTLNVADLESGVYFLNITTVSGINTVRFIKK